MSKDKLKSAAASSFRCDAEKIAKFMRYAQAGRPECFLAVRKFQCAVFEMELAIRECEINDSQREG